MANDFVKGAAAEAAAEEFGEGIIPTKEVVLLVDVDRIEADPDQPRQEFDETELEELRRSLEAVGQKQNVTLRRNPDKPGHFILVDGERRWRCAKAIGPKKFPRLKAILKSKVAEGEEAYIESILANWNRAGHTPIETMNAVVRVFKHYRESRDRTAAAFGKSPSWVDQYLTLRRLPDSVLAFMKPPFPKKQRLKMAVALLLVPLNDGPLQLRLAKQFFKAKTSVNWAKTVIDRRLREQGVVRKRTKGSRNKLLRFMVISAEKIESLSEMDDNDLTYLFRNHQEEARMVVDLARGLEEKISTMRSRIERIFPGTVAK